MPLRVRIKPLASDAVQTHACSCIPVHVLKMVKTHAAAPIHPAFLLSLCFFSAPTYILSECVMVYMEPEHSSAVVRWLADTFKSAAALAIYEQVCTLCSDSSLESISACCCPLGCMQAWRERHATFAWASFALY